MKALILAAGMGTRLKHLTTTRPKPMLPVGRRPLLEHLIGWLRDAGITEIAINLHHCPTSVTEHFGDGRRFGVNLTYSYEPELLGTAGAAKRLQEYLDRPFVVVYGDVFTNLNLSRLCEFHSAQRAASGGLPTLTMALYRVPNPTECGLVHLDDTGRVVQFVEKPPADQVFTDLANAGILVCEPGILNYVPANTFFDFGRDLFPLLLATHIPMFGQPIADDEYVIDIGTPGGYAAAQQRAAAAAHERQLHMASER